MQNKTPTVTDPLYPDERLLRIRDVATRTGLKQHQILALSAISDFPASAVAARDTLVWSEREVLAWIAERLKTRDHADRRINFIEYLRGGYYQNEIDAIENKKVSR